MTRQPPKVAFLDQNKWIDLAHAFDNPKGDLRTFEVGQQLIHKVQSGELLLPLTSNLIVETYKMRDFAHRTLIAEVQAKLSQGYVFRDRRFRLLHEISFAVRDLEGLSALKAPHFWWLSRNFAEAFHEWSILESEFGAQQDQLEGIRSDPKFALFHWLSATPENERARAMANDAAIADNLIELIESRIARLHGTTFSIRRRAYTAILCLDEQVRIGAIARANNVPWLSDGDDRERRLEQLKQILEKVPSYRAEIELAIRAETLGRKITRNDLGDMGAFVASAPYADVVIGEKTFVNMSKQAKFPNIFGCKLSKDLTELISLLS